MPDGSEGELVLTSLTKEAFPVVRYRTRDLTALLPGTARSMRRVHKITGRCDDMIILRGVNMFPTQIEELILDTDVLAPQFQCVLDRPGRLDQMTVRVESRHAITEGQRQLAADSLTERIKNRIGVSVTVSILNPESLERSAGKAKRIIDQRPKG